MFERFTERARRVVVLAQDQARGLGHDWIGTEHLLLGLLCEGEAVGWALEDGGLTLERARQATTALVGVGETSPSGQLAFTRHAKKALEESLRESTRMESGEVAPQHLLLGVLARHSGSAACVLRDCDVDVAGVLAALGIDDGGDAARFLPDADAKAERMLSGP